MTVFAYTDGASRGNPGESGIGVILRDEEGTVLYSGCGYIGQATNNIAEYRALLACLEKARTLSCDRLIVHSDSELMVRQLQRKYRVKDRTLRRFYDEANRLIAGAPFKFEIVHIERGQNSDADMLANEGIESRQALQV